MGEGEEKTFILTLTLTVLVTSHVHAPNPEETISMEFKSNITSGATTSHDPPGRIIHQALLNVNKNDGSAVPNYSSSQRTIEGKRKKRFTIIATNFIQ
jgi:hypothetical protein